MNSKIAFIIGTVVGAGIGVAGTYSYFKDKYEKLAEEDFNSRRAFDQDKKDESEEPVTEKTADSRTVYNPSIAECAAILQKQILVISLPERFWQSCCECLDHGCNTQSERPVNWKEKNE